LLITDARKPPTANAVLVVENGKIRAGGTIPAGAEVLDPSAYPVMPGLMDGHAHLWTGPGT